MTAVACLLILVGSAFGLSAALGLLRFPELFTRMHAAAKAGPLGAGMILLGVGCLSADFWTAVRCVLGVVFLIMVSPISAHLLARATRRTGSLPANISSIKNIHDSRHP